MYEPYENHENSTAASAQADPIPAPQPASASTPQPEAPRKKGGKKFLKLVAAACVFGILAGACFGGVNWAIKSLTEPDGDSAPPIATPHVETTVLGGTTEIPYTTVISSNGGSAILDVTQVVENAMPAMVSINVVVTQTVQDPFSGFGDFFGFGGFGGFGDYEQEVPGSGSGIIIGENDKELLVVTNNHVVGDANEIAVEFIDGTTAKASIKGNNADFDIAVISVALEELTAETRSSIKIAVMGDSDSLALGEPAIAIGNALGYGQSVTVGYISALEREVRLTDGTMTLLQTDAAINPGNSGGALLNLQGEVVGINSAKYSGTEVEGMGYAIPISDAIPLINTLMNAVPESERPYLGISGQDVPESYQSYFDWPQGVYVVEVAAGSPAVLAGLRQGDIIVGFNGQPISGMQQLQDALALCAVGDQATIEVVRGVNSPDGKHSLEKITLKAILIAKGDAVS